MFTYILRRILLFFPTLVIISLLAFVISVSSPEKPEGLDTHDLSGSSLQGLQSYQIKEKARQRTREIYNLDLPVFYFRLASLAEPDTLYRIYDQDQRASLGRLLHRYGNWPEVEAYHQSLRNLLWAHSPLKKQLMAARPPDLQQVIDRLEESQTLTTALLLEAREVPLAFRLGLLDSLYQHNESLDALREPFGQVQQARARLKAEATPWKNYLPCFIWHGTQNQYHKWITGILLRFDFGYSYRNMKPVSQHISEHFFWSFVFTLSSVILAYLLAIPLGILGAAYHGKAFDRISTVAIFAIDSMPSYLFALLLLIFFANPDFPALEWFPSSFNEVVLEEKPLWASFFSDLNRLVLPLIAYTYGQVAYLSRLVRSNMLEVIQQDYIRTARAKGLPFRRVLLRHAFRNASLPVITTFAGAFPAMIGGNVILEKIFGIPGMGGAILQACYEKDVPMIMAVFVLVGVMVMLGYLVSDLLYTWAVPHVKLNGKD
jgi:peptide/nickel transport system permease protein